MEQKIKSLLSKTGTFAYTKQILFTILCIVWRCIPHLPNVTPLNAHAILSGKKSSSIPSFIFPLIPALIGDLAWGFHGTTPYVYAALILITYLGTRIRQGGYMALCLCSLTSSLLFFFITNTGSWLTSGMYPFSLAGLTKALLLGIPFLNYAICVDLLFITIFYATSHSLIKKEIFSKTSITENNSALH